MFNTFCVLPNNALHFLCIWISCLYKLHFLSIYPLNYWGVPNFRFVYFYLFLTTISVRRAPLYSLAFLVIKTCIDIGKTCKIKFTFSMLHITNLNWIYINFKSMKICLPLHSSQMLFPLADWLKQTIWNSTDAYITKEEIWLQGILCFNILIRLAKFYLHLYTYHGNCWYNHVTTDNKLISVNCFVHCKTFN